MHILVVEDQKKVAEALQEGLTLAGFKVTVCSEGEEGFFTLSSQDIDLLILDLGLPKRDGIEILRAVRHKKIGVPIMILTARDSVEDRVLGLESGADDYLVKPFAFPELLARVQALLRRSQMRIDDVMKVGDLELDLRTRKASRSSQPLSLTVKELDILEYLLRYHESVVSREMLVRDLWHGAARATPIDNIIDVHIAHLRSKIDGPFPLKLLHTVRGVGFILSVKKP